MKAAGLAALSLAGLFAHAVSAKEIKPDFGVSEYYDTGAVHEQLMAKKMVSCGLAPPPPAKTSLCS